MKYELQNVISGESQVRFGAAISSALRHLRAGSSAGTLDKTDKHFKSEETERLKKYIEKQSLWIEDINLDNYVSEGAEQKVYLKDSRSVVKLNDAIYYLSWEDYFVNLLLHNYFFPDTAYRLLGFFKSGIVVYAVVEQAFVRTTEPTDLLRVEKFMTLNGFLKTRNNDYFNPELGIILEDLHDENVLTNDGILYFIDTVFYVK